MAKKNVCVSILFVHLKDRKVQVWSIYIFNFRVEVPAGTSPFEHTEVVQGQGEICLRQLRALIRVLDVTKCERLLPFLEEKNGGKIASERIFSTSSFLSHFDFTVNDAVEWACF